MKFTLAMNKQPHHIKHFKFFGRKPNNTQLIITDPRLIKLAVLSEKMSFALWDIDNMLRQEYRYKNNDSVYDIREVFHRILDDNGLNLDDLNE